MNLKFEVSATAIIKRSDGRFLLLHRSESKKRNPGKWTIPGGHVERNDFSFEPNNDGWIYRVIENAVIRETREETGLWIKNLRYLTSLTGDTEEPLIIISMIAEMENESDTVTIDVKETSEFGWFNLEEAKSVNLIDGIYDELVMVEAL